MISGISHTSTEDSGYMGVTITIESTDQRRSGWRIERDLRNISPAAECALKQHIR